MKGYRVVNERAWLELKRAMDTMGRELGAHSEDVILLAFSRAMRAGIIERVDNRLEAASSGLYVVPGLEAAE